MNKRIEYIDIAKFIGVFLMIVGHRVSGPIKEYIYLFHMPMLFILSGLVMSSRNKSFKEIIISENKLLITYLLYSIVFALFDFSEDFLISPLIGSIFKTLLFCGIDSMWFLSALYLSKIIIKSIDNKLSNPCQIIIVLSLFTVSFICAPFTRTFNPDTASLKILMYIVQGLTRFASAILFVFIGYKFKDYILKACAYINGKVVINVAILILSFFLLIPFINIMSLDYHTFKYGIYGLNVFTSIVGTILVLSLSIFIDKYFKFISKLFSKLGKESVHIMTFEHLKLGYLSNYLSNLIYNDSLILTLFVHLILLILLTYSLFPIIDLAIRKISNFIEPTIKNKA